MGRGIYFWRGLVLCGSTYTGTWPTFPLGGSQIVPSSFFFLCPVYIFPNPESFRKLKSFRCDFFYCHLVTKVLILLVTQGRILRHRLIVNSYSHLIPVKFCSFQSFRSRRFMRKSPSMTFSTKWRGVFSLSFVSMSDIPCPWDFIHYTLPLWVYYHFLLRVLLSTRSPALPVVESMVNTHLTKFSSKSFRLLLNHT